MSATVTLPLEDYEALKRKLDGQRLAIKELTKNEETVYKEIGGYFTEELMILNPKKSELKLLGIIEKRDFEIEKLKKEIEQLENRRFVFKLFK